MLTRNLAFLATLAVATVVLFPAVSGPFTATFGPACAFRAIAYAALVAFALTMLVAVSRQSPVMLLTRQPATVIVADFGPLPTVSLRC